MGVLSWLVARLVRLFELVTLALMPVVEWGLLPDFVVVWATQLILRGRVRSLPQQPGALHDYVNAFVDDLRERPVAECAEQANAQHYEVPAEFFQLVLGRRLKYSAGYWPPGVGDLDQSEEAALQLFAERARLVDGQQVIDVGCGWGSLTLFVAERYPRSHVTCLSNSRAQSLFIVEQCRRRGLNNVRSIVADLATFDDPELAGRFDRAVSVECFEHMKNYDRLLAKVAAWLRPQGKLCVHVFVHAGAPYHFDDDGWMSREFFSGGTMPSDHLFLRFARHLRVEKHWAIDGTHYARTCWSWLARMRARRAAVVDIFARTYGANNARRWFVKWELFFIACAALFQYKNGSQWYVSHYLFEKN